MVVHAGDHSHADGGKKIEIVGKKCQILSEKIAKAQKGWRHGSNGRVPAWQVQGPEFSPNMYKKKKKGKKSEITEKRERVIELKD
jgi:hypothetical protein